MDDFAKKISLILTSMAKPKKISESVHKELQDIMDSTDIPVHEKMNYVSGKARQLISSGEDSGLEDDTPKQGSSRAVFFPNQHKLIHLDGHVVETPSVVKIAFPGQLDKFNKSGKLLGEHQNKVESDRSINNKYSVITQHPDTGEWHTNPHGILPPHFGHHPDHHYLEMGRVTPVSDSGDFAFNQATKTPEHPEGISHRQFDWGVSEHWEIAHGNGAEKYSPKLKAVLDHPVVKNAFDLVSNTDIHPGDFHENNIGLWHHPVTGKQHVVISDFGYSNEVAKHYRDARANMFFDERNQD